MVTLECKSAQTDTGLNERVEMRGWRHDQPPHGVTRGVVLVWRRRAQRGPGRVSDRVGITVRFPL